MIVLIDNYDSFTYNIVQVLGDCGATDVKVYRNNKIDASEVFSLNPRAIILSPGPGNPDQSGVCIDILNAYRDQNAKAISIPLLGVCLGHQAIGQVFGGTVCKAPAPVHGKTSTLTHTDQGLFQSLPQNSAVARYHSLVIDRATCPACLDITAQTDDGLIMGVAHKTLPIHGVQFHPESIATQDGAILFKNFIAGLTPIMARTA